MTQEQQAQLAKLEETIRVAQQQIYELKNPKPKKFEWKYESKGTYIVNTHTYEWHYNGSDKDYIEHSRYRLTKEAAEQSLARNKRANRLEALAEQLGGLKEFEYNVENYYVYKDCIFKYNFTENSFYTEVVYMTEECAIEICRMLNEGEFSLEGEL